MIRSPSRDDVIAVLPRFTRADLQELQVRISALLGDADSEGPAIVHGVVVEYMRRRGGSGNMPYSVLKRSKQFPRFNKGALVLLKFIDDYLPKIVRVERRKAIYVLVGAAVKYLEYQHIPIGFYTIGDALTRINQVVDYQFPGYIEAGLITAIVKGVA